MAELLTDANAPDPVLPGASFIFEATQQAAVASNPGATVVVAAAGDYGPVNAVQEIPKYADGLTIFGPDDTPIRRAIFGAFLGEGIPGRGGAGAVKAVRLAGAGSAKASRILVNTGAANAVTLTAKQPGSRPNGWAVTVRPGAVAGTNDLVILDGAREAETFNHATADLAALVADINAGSAYVDAALNLDGVALAPAAAVALAGGNDGAAFTTGDYTAMLDLLEFEEFGVFAAFGVADPVIVTALKAWKDDVKARGKRVRVVVGGPAAESFAAHKTRAAGLNDPDFICFGTGSIGASELTLDGSELTIPTSEGVARVAGAWARRDEQNDMVNVRFAGWRIIGGATRSQAQVAAKSGMSLLTRDGDATAPVKIPLGVTSYTGNTEDRPFVIYSNAKFVATMHGLERDITADQEGGNDELIDGRGVDPKARDLIKGRATDVIKRRIGRGVLQPGSTVGFDPERPYSPGDPVVALVYQAELVPGLRGIRNRIVVGV